jgi:tetratricopeptide (TPR) repeat protein
LFRSLGEASSVADVHLAYAHLAHESDDVPLALKHLERGISDFTRLGEWSSLTRALIYKGKVMDYENRTAEAVAAFEEALNAAEKIGDGRVRSRIVREMKKATAEEIIVLSLGQ